MNVFSQLIVFNINKAGIAKDIAQGVPTRLCKHNVQFKTSSVICHNERNFLSCRQQHTLVSRRLSAVHFKKIVVFAYPTSTYIYNPSIYLLQPHRLPRRYCSRSGRHRRQPGQSGRQSPAVQLYTAADPGRYKPSTSTKLTRYEAGKK